MTQGFQFMAAEAVDVMNPPTFGVFEAAFQGLENATISFAPGTVNLVFDDLVGYTLS